MTMIRLKSAAFSIILLAIPLLSHAQNSNFNATDRIIAQYQSRVATAPNVSAYDGLGAAYLQKGRDTSDLTYFDLAEKSLLKSLELTSSWDVAAASPLTHLAAVCMAEHRFADAAAYAKQAIAAGAGDLAPFALLGDAYTDMGEYDKAQSAYSKLQLQGQAPEQIRGMTYMYDTRISYLKMLRGDDAGAIRLMQQAVMLALEDRMPKENIAWTYYQLGEDYFHSGDLENAAKAYQESLARYPSYYRGLGGLAKVRVAQLNYKEGIELYQQAIATIPLIEYVVALADVYEKVGRTQDAGQQQKLMEFIAHVNPLSQRAYNRELAGFYADHNEKSSEAVSLAKAELENRNDVFTRDVYAWCLYKNGNLKAAADAIDQALSLGTKDALMFFHAGIIYRDLGETARAESYLSRSLAVNPQFHVLYAATAEKALQDIRAKRPTLDADNKVRTIKLWAINMLEWEIIRDSIPTKSSMRAVAICTINFARLSSVSARQLCPSHGEFQH